MRAFWDARQLAHAPALELHNGGFVPFAEAPARAEAIAAERATIASLERDGARRAAERSPDRLAASPGPTPLIRWSFQDGIAPAGTWSHWWREQVQAKREQAPWMATQHAGADTAATAATSSAANIATAAKAS